MDLWKSTSASATDWTARKSTICQPASMRRPGSSRSMRPSRAVAGLEKNPGEPRRALYDRARNALLKQLSGVTPPLPESDIRRERLALEEAIRKVEGDAARRMRPDAPRPPTRATPGPQEPAAPAPGAPATPPAAAEA